jgi:hypothetical protein
MTKRLKYTKDILTHMLNNNGATGTNAPQTAKNPQNSNSMRGSSVGGQNAPITVNSRQSEVRLVSASSIDRKGLNTPGNLPKF